MKGKGQKKVKKQFTYVLNIEDKMIKDNPQITYYTIDVTKYTIKTAKIIK